MTRSSCIFWSRCARSGRISGRYASRAFVHQGCGGGSVFFPVFPFVVWFFDMEKKALKIALAALVVFHGYIVVANVLAFFVLPFLTDWYIAVPCMSSILFLMFARGVSCPLTDLENFLRQRLGLKRIGGFVGHYFIKPWRRLWAKGTR